MLPQLCKIELKQACRTFLRNGLIYCRRSQARSQEFAMGGCFGDLGADSPAAGGEWDLGAKLPAAGGWGSGGKAPSRRRHRGLGAEPPALGNFAFFCKNNLILKLF